MSSKKKIIAVVITTAALTVGTVGIAGAASKTVRTNKTTITSMAGPSAAGRVGHEAQLTALLSSLVAKGTITEAQADAVIAAAKAAEVAREALRPAKSSINEKLSLIATTIGIDSATIVTRLQGGETLASIAGAKKDALIAALVADETKRIDAAVTAGKVSAAQATTLKSNLVAHVTAAVNSNMAKGPKMGHRDGKGGPKGDSGRDKRGPKGGANGMGGNAPQIPAPTTTASAN